MELFYLKPAENWNEANPIGCGRLGGMIYASPKCEQIQLNEESMWTGYYDGSSDNPDCADKLPLMRRLIFDGRLKEASALAEKYLVCRGRGSEGEAYGSFTTAGDLYIAVEGERGIKGYRRGLDIESGVGKVSYDTANGRSTREYVASLKYGVIAVSFTFAAPVDIAMNYKRSATAVHCEGAVLTAKGNFKGGISYAVLAEIVTDSGIFKTDRDAVKLSGTTGFTLYIDVRTNYMPPDPVHGMCLRDTEYPISECKKTVSAAKAAGFIKVRDTSRELFSEMMNRTYVRFDSDKSKDALPTDERIRLVGEGEDDPGLDELYFEFGKYLLISSSYNCRLPANLQGIWTNDEKSAWNGDYHININTQMNYWHAEVCGLGELVAPFLKYIRFISEFGKKTAAIQYNCGGWCAHTVTNPWGFTSPGEGGSWGSFMAAGAWCILAIKERYLYSGDPAVLRDCLDVIEGACRFFFDYLTPTPDGKYLITAPSNSPENSYIGNDGEIYAICAGPSMDTEIVREILNLYIDACKILGIRTQDTDKAEKTLARLAPLSIGEHGNIMEWMEDYRELEPGHRHISQLFALYPANQINEETPELMCAAERTLERRLENGGGHTGWSRAWIINFYARLGRGEKCHENLRALLGKCTLPNMLDDHPPFQIDGNFGGCAAIAEMLLNSAGERVKLLPALPMARPSGSFRLYARGGEIIEHSWKTEDA